MEKETTISIIAIILGAVGLIFPIFIPCFIALILGFYAYSNDENLGLIGLILGALGVVINALMFAGVIPWFYGII